MQHVTLDPRRRDAREYHYSKMTDSPHLRMVYQRFLEDGMLLPFGHSRLDFVYPNGALFPEDITYSYAESGSPLAAWGVLDVNKTPWAAENDLYGKLYCFLRGVVGNCLHWLGPNEIGLCFHNVPIRTLPSRLAKREYDRIEYFLATQVSNVCGREELSIRDTFQLFSGHLKDPADNPHATLMTWFVNAAKEPKDARGNAQSLPITFRLQLLYNNFDSKAPASHQVFTLVHVPGFIDRYFTEYMNTREFEQIAGESGMEMKSENTVVDKWASVALNGGREDLENHEGLGPNRLLSLCQQQQIAASTMVSLAPFVLKRPWLVKALTPAANWYAGASGYRQLGLRYDDLLEEENEAVQIALKRLSAKESYERVYRIRRSVQCSYTHKLLPKDQWTKPEEDVPYLRNILAQVEAELAEKDALDSMTVIKKH
ncbi:hypothetical protein Trihar35433_7069 [Trichoderma harzianum]|nr:hypothetical protein Trihar35433_7069 [Trichoderma harzianum]